MRNGCFHNDGAEVGFGAGRSVQTSEENNENGPQLLYKANEDVEIGTTSEL